MNYGRGDAVSVVSLDPGLADCSRVFCSAICCSLKPIRLIRSDLRCESDPGSELTIDSRSSQVASRESANGIGCQRSDVS